MKGLVALTLFAALSLAQDASQVRLALGRLESGDAGGAAAVLEPYTRKHPDDARGLLLLGRSYALSGAPEKAIGPLRRAAGLTPDSQQAHFSLGMVEAMLGNRSAARSSFERVLKLEPAHQQANFNLARILAEEGACNRALPLLDRSLAAQRSDVETLFLMVQCAPPSAAEAYRTKLLAVAPRDLSVHARLACRLQQGSDLRLAQKEFDYALGLVGADQSRTAAGEYFELGKCSERARDPVKAFGAYDAALGLDPDRLEYYLQMAELFSSQQIASGAQDALRRAIARFPDSVMAKAALGMALLASGDLKGAESVDGELSAANPRGQPVLLFHGRILMAQHAYPAAIAVFNQLSELAPRDFRAYEFAAECWEKEEDGTEAALKAYRHAVALNPERAGAFFRLGALLFQRKEDPSAAIPYLERAVELDPTGESAHQMLAQAYSALGLGRKAEAQIQKLNVIRQRSQPRSDLRTFLETR